jgi:hypothetical protein
MNYHELQSVELLRVSQSKPVKPVGHVQLITPAVLITHPAVGAHAAQISIDTNQWCIDLPSTTIVFTYLMYYTVAIVD